MKLAAAAALPLAALAVTFLTLLPTLWNTLPKEISVFFLLLLSQSASVFL